MKKIIFPLVIALFALVSTDAYSQCKQQFVYSCAKDNGNAIYLRDFNVKLKAKKERDEAPPVEKFAVVLNKNTKYRFNLCSPSDDAGKAVLTLYDGKKKIGSTYISEKDQDLNGFDFICRKSSVYHVTIKMRNGKKGNAVGILSFVGKAK